MAIDTKAKRFEILDGMRGVAAILVMCYHFCLFNGIQKLDNVPACVDLFFILSGFVVAHSYGERLNQGMTASSYLYKRFVRLYPMFILALAFGSVTLFFAAESGYATYTPKSVFLSFLANGAFLPFLNSLSVTNGLATASGQPFPADNALWSLSFEMLASIIFLGLYKRSTVTLSIISILSMVTLEILARLLSWHAPGVSTRSYMGGVPRVLYGFCMGMVIYRVTPFVRGKYLQIFLNIPYRSLLIYVAMISFFTLPMTITGYYFFLIVAVAPTLILAGSLTVPENKAYAKAANFLGWLSYPVYCLHMPVFRALYLLHEKYGLSGHVPVAVVAVLATIALSVLVAKLYDEPIRRLLSKWCPGGKSDLQLKLSPALIVPASDG